MDPSQDTRQALISRHVSPLLPVAQGQQGAQRFGPGQAPEVTAPQWLTLLLSGLKVQRHENWEGGSKHSDRQIHVELARLHVCNGVPDELRLYGIEGPDDLPAAQSNLLL